MKLEANNHMIATINGLCVFFKLTQSIFISIKYVNNTGIIDIPFITEEIIKYIFCLILQSY